MVKKYCQEFNFLSILNLTGILYNSCTDKWFLFLHTTKRVNFVYFNLKDCLYDSKIKKKSEKFLEVNLKIYKINTICLWHNIQEYCKVDEEISNFFQ